MTVKHQYSIKLYFTNLDDNLETDHQVHICFPDVYAENLHHAELLAQRLEKIHGADDYEVI